MGDISEMRGLILTISFLGVFALLILWIPSGFYTSPDLKTVDTPIFFEGIDIYSFADYANTPMNETGGSIYVLDNDWYYVSPDDDGQGETEVGGRDLQLWYKRANKSNLELKQRHLYGKYFFVFVHWQSFYDNQGIMRAHGGDDTLTVAEIEANSQDNYTSRWKTQCDHFHMTVIFNYNNTKYDNFTHAWNMHGLWAFHGIDFDQTSTAYNAWDLIAKLLFFQMPDCNVYVNAIMAIPIWTCIGYLIFILVLRTIGAIFGGGA